MEHADRPKNVQTNIRYPSLYLLVTDILTSDERKQTDRQEDWQADKEKTCEE